MTLSDVMWCEHVQKVVIQLSCKEHVWMRSSGLKVMLSSVYWDQWYQLRECSQAVFDCVFFMYRGACYLLLCNILIQNLVMVSKAPGVYSQEPAVQVE